MGSTTTTRKTLRDVLRAETDEAHQRLHHHSSFAALLAGTIDLRDYVRLLQRLHAFHAPLDQAIDAALVVDQSVPFSYVRRSELLARDLADLGNGATICSPPLHCPCAKTFVTPATVGGVLYVVEGAALGGALIDRAASKVLEEETTAGRGYWAWCRAEGKHRWSLTLRHLERLNALGHAVDDLVEGARATFLQLGDWLAPLDRPMLTADVRGA